MLRCVFLKFETFKLRILGRILTLRFLTKSLNSNENKNNRNCKVQISTYLKI